MTSAGGPEPAGRATARPRAGKGPARRGRPATRTHILDAARELIRTGGFQGLSFEHIALAAGVGEDVVLRHFPDQNAILAELIDNRPAAAEPRRTERDTKARIVAAARTLFGDRGFHAISVDDLAAAVGITGPAVYRHFDCKEDILAAALNSLLGDATERVWGSAALPDPDPDGDGGGGDTIEHALARDADFVVENAGLVTLWQSEWRHLKPTARAHNVAIQRRYVQGFIDLLLQRRTELTAAHAETMVVAALALIMGAAVHPHNELEGPELAALLSGMAVSSLGITETS